MSKLHEGGPGSGDHDHSGRKGEVGGSGGGASGSGTPFEYGNDKTAQAAAKRRQATRAAMKEEPLAPHEQQLVDRLDAHDPEITTQVLRNGKMVDEKWPHEWS